MCCCSALFLRLTGFQLLWFCSWRGFSCCDSAPDGVPVVVILQVTGFQSLRFCGWRGSSRCKDGYTLQPKGLLCFAGAEFPLLHPAAEGRV